MSWFSGKKIAVFGAAGSIGGKVVEMLLKSQIRAIECFSKNCEQAQVVETRHKALTIRSYSNDVTQLENFDPALCDDTEGIVVAVGHCPADGFEKAISLPIIDMPIKDLFGIQWKLHVEARVKLLKFVAPCLRMDTRIVFVSSAITRLTQNGELPPPFLHAADYAAAIAAGDEIVRYARIDPVIRDKNIKLDLVKLGPVDTPFHRNSKHRPPVMLSIEEAAQAILDALERGEGTDHWVMAKETSKKEREHPLARIVENILDEDQ